MTILYVVKYEQSDPWYSPAFGGVFDDLEKAKAFAESGHYSRHDYDSGHKHRFLWDNNQLFVFDEDGYEETGTFIEETQLNRKPYFTEEENEPGQ